MAGRVRRTRPAVLEMIEPRLSLQGPRSLRMRDCGDRNARLDARIDRHSLQPNELPSVRTETEVGTDWPPPRFVFGAIGRDLDHDEAVHRGWQTTRRVDGRGRARRI